MSWCADFEFRVTHRLAPQMIVQVFDSDENWYAKKKSEESDDFLGRTAISLDDAAVVSTFQKIKRPIWTDLMLMVSWCCCECCAVPLCRVLCAVCCVLCCSVLRFS